MRKQRNKTVTGSLKALALVGMMTLGTAIGAGPALADSPLATQPAVPEDGVEIGVLDCQTVPGTRRNVILHSSVDLDCTFETLGGTERYSGKTGVGLGLDLSAMKNERMLFSVLTMGSNVRAGSHGLAGRYFGGQVSAAFGPGLGAASLVGAGDGQVALEPLALKAGEGIGASAGISYLTLQAATE